MKSMKKYLRLFCVIIFVTMCFIGFLTLNVNQRRNALKRKFIELNVSNNFNAFHGPLGFKQTTRRTVTPHISTQELSINKSPYLLKPKIRFLNSKLKDNNDCDQEICLEDKKIKWEMYTFVKSKAEHVNRREIIRMSWGGVFYMNEVKFKTVFVIGKANETTQLLIEKEIQLFGDILQIDEDDGYQNVPMKVLAGMQWAADNLADDVLYSTADDDMGVDVLKLQEEIEKAKARTTINKWPEFPIICSYDMWKKLGVPQRNTAHKNFISKQKYRWTKWPKFCLGGMYSTSVRVIKQLHEISRTKDMINTDDVWITGILRNILGMPDEMLIKVRPVVAKHLTDYYVKNPDKTKLRVLALWKQRLKEYKSQNWCTC